MPDWIAKLLQEWPLVAAAPIPFAIAFVGIAAAISLAVGWFYRGVLASALIAGCWIIGTDRAGRPRRKKIQMRWSEWSP